MSDTGSRTTNDFNNIYNGLPDLGRYTPTPFLTQFGNLASQKVKLALKKRNTTTSWPPNGKSPINTGIIPGPSLLKQAMSNVDQDASTADNRITSNLSIKQNDVVTLLKSDLLFRSLNDPIPPLNAVPTRFRPSGVLTYQNVQPSVNGYNVQTVNHLMAELQITKLRHAGVNPSNLLFYRDVLGSPSDYLARWSPWGMIYDCINAMGGDWENTNTGGPSNGRPFGYYEHSGAISATILHRGYSAEIRNIWNSVLDGGTALYMVLKPTIVDASQKFVVGVTPTSVQGIGSNPVYSTTTPNPSTVKTIRRPSERLPSMEVDSDEEDDYDSDKTKMVLDNDTTDIADFSFQSNGNFSGKLRDNETFVIYQWHPWAISGEPDIIVEEALTYSANVVDSSFIRGDLQENEFSACTGAYCQVGTLRHTLSPRRLPGLGYDLCTDYLKYTKCPPIELDVCHTKTHVHDP